jgi:cell envelope opacity-associated protein A
MLKSSAILLACCAAALFASPAGAQQGFKFSNPSPDEQREAAAKADKQAQVDWQLSTPCRDRIRNRKIMVLVGEEVNGRVAASQNQFGRHVEAINARLQGLGLKTYSAEQIRKQVAQEEVDAYFKNDPDRALSASKRLAAQYVLKGVIATQAFRNNMVNVNQVNVAMDFTLVDAAGRPVSNARATNASYAGADVSGMALTLIEERADQIVAQLYSDYCRNAR